MTNFEYYKEDILKITNEGESLGVCKNSGKPVKCTSITCNECVSGNGLGCDKGLYAWLYKEYKEYIEPPKQPKLTKKERQFCELVETGWIARSRIGILVYRLEDNKPSKDYTRGIWYGDNIRSKLMINVHEMFPNINFSFITWDDEEPWSVEDLLKLEVEE